MRRSTRVFRRTCSPRRFTSASARAARPSSPTSCSPRCATSLAVIWKRKARMMRTKTFRNKAGQMAAALPIARSGFDLVGVRRVPTIQVPKSERFARAVQIFSVIAFPHMERSRLPSEIPGGGLQANGAPSRPPLCEAHAYRLRSPCPSALRRAHRGSGHTVQPRTAGALHRSRVRFEVAEHRGARWKEYSRFMRMVPFSPRGPSPRASHCRQWLARPRSP